MDSWSLFARPGLSSISHEVLGPAQGQLQQTTMRWERSESWALGKGYSPRLETHYDRRAVADTDPRERGAWEPIAGIWAPGRMGLVASIHPLSRERRCPEWKDPGCLLEEVATELGFEEWGLQRKNSNVGRGTRPSESSFIRMTGIEIRLYWFEEQRE